MLFNHSLPTTPKLGHQLIQQLPKAFQLRAQRLHLGQQQANQYRIMLGFE